MKPINIMVGVEFASARSGTRVVVRKDFAPSSSLSVLDPLQATALIESITTWVTSRIRLMELQGKLDGQQPKNNEPIRDLRDNLNATDTSSKSIPVVHAKVEYDAQYNPIVSGLPKGLEPGIYILIAD